MGGLGNQMCQYALYRSLLKNGLDKEVKFDISWFQYLTEQKKKDTGRELRFELPLFGTLPLPICTEDEKKRVLKKSAGRKFFSKVFTKLDTRFVETKMYHPEIFQLKNRYLDGYFLCQQYYESIVEELQDLFHFPHHSNPELDRKNYEIMERMEQENSISLHIRRGDYLNPVNQKIYGDITTEQYYKSAMDFVQERYKSVRFYVFSDDPKYAELVYKDQTKYTVVKHNQGRESMLDMQLMSHCKGNICANSTFSLWGAQLNKHPDKIMIRPLKMKKTEQDDTSIKHKYWPEWIFIDDNGIVC